MFRLAEADQPGGWRALGGHSGVGERTFWTGVGLTGRQIELGGVKPAKAGVTPTPTWTGLTQGAQNCINKFDGIDLSSPIEAAGTLRGARGQKPCDENWEHQLFYVWRLGKPS